MQYLEQKNIKALLEKAIDFGGEVERPLIFSREKFEIIKLEITGDALEILLDEEIPPHQDARHIYINLHYRRMNFIIKARDYEVVGNVIKTKIPTAAKAIEERPNTRYRLEFEKFPTMVSRTERRGGKHEHETFVEDISETGLSLLMSITEEEEIKVNDHIWIKSIGENLLESPLFAKVIYIRHIDITGRTFKKAGVKLEKSFDEEVFSKIIESSIKKLVA